MPYTHTALQLFATVGYPGLCALLLVAALGIGAPIPGAALLLALGALSGARGGPNLLALASVALLGLVAGHAADYWAGRLGFRLLLVRFTAISRRAPWLHTLVNRSRRTGWPALLLFLSRFLLTPVASPVSLLVGAARVRFGRYLALETPGTAIYVAANLALGHALGPRAVGGGAGLLLFWLVVTALTLLPFALLWLASRLVVRMKLGPAL